MRKLNKKHELSTVYKKWEDDLEKNNKPYPKYNSTKGEFYTDIFTNLLNLQNGLCAYTEIYLCNPKKVKVENWKEGRFYKQKIRVKELCKGGSLDHFDPKLKENKAWLFENLFFIDTDINNWKKNKEVDNILKPDLKEYDEYELLEYDNKEHIFLANTNLDMAKQERINKMLDTLGINLVKDIRQEYLNPIIEDITLGNIKTWEDTKVYQFPTAFKMCKKTN